MKDDKTLAYINMFAILGSLEELCRLSDEASALVTNKKPISIGFAVKNGPSMTLTFKDGGCCAAEGVSKCDVKLPFSSCAKFNGLIDGTVTPIPSKGFTKIKFLLNTFVKLTDVLQKYLRASKEDLADETFFNASTELMLCVITSAIAQIGNHDKIGSFSASHIEDGAAMLSIKNGPGSTIHIKDHTMRTEKKRVENYRAVMEFSSMKLARQLFDGEVNAIACIGTGEIEVKGLMSMLDNINRILDRVAVYLA